MTERDIMIIMLDFWGRFSVSLWNFSEENNAPIGELAPIIFGLMIGYPGHKIDGSGVEMKIYLTEYQDSQHQKWAGSDIEAESLEKAKEIAASVSKLEKSLPDPRFKSLTVLGEKVSEEVFSPEQVHAVSNMTCVNCNRAWVAVYPGGTEFLHCPSCNARNKVSAVISSDEH